MSSISSPQRKAAILTLVASSTTLALVLVVIVFSGLYDVAADNPHYPIVSSTLDMLRERSIARHARDIAVPNLEDAAMIAEGAEHYSAMCTGCHLAPGVTDSEIRPGLYPQPPNLATTGIGDPKAAFWTIKHGIKMSGMPAWGSSHDDEAIWNIVAFLRKMPTMTPESYRALVSKQEAGSDATEDEGAPSAPAPEHAHHHTP